MGNTLFRNTKNIQKRNVKLPKNFKDFVKEIKNNPAYVWSPYYGLQ